MNPESILDIYRRAWMLMSVPMKQKIILGLNVLEGGTHHDGDALLADFAEWCRANHDPN